MTNEREFNGFDNGLRILAGMIVRVYVKDKAAKKLAQSDDPAIAKERNGDTKQLQGNA